MYMIVSVFVRRWWPICTSHRVFVVL